MSKYWSAISDPGLIWRLWGNEYVVYNDLTGNTHRLDFLPARALQSLESTPATVEELSTRISAISGDEVDDGVIKSTQKLIDEFKRCGLIEPIES